VPVPGGRRCTFIFFLTGISGKLLHRQGFQEGLLRLRHVYENKPPGLVSLAPGPRDNGDSGAASAAIAGAVGETVVLSAEGEGSAALAALVEVLALVRGVRMWLVAAAKGLAGKSPAAAGLAFAKGGAEAWHRCLRE